MTDERDARLSALLDGALAAPEEAALRDEIARDPALAARLAQLARVDAALRALPARPVPADLRTRLQAKLDAEATAAAASERPQLSAIRGGAAAQAPTRPSRRRAWIAGFSAAVAAAAAALVVVFGGPNADPSSPPSDAPQLARERAASPRASASPEDAPLIASVPVDNGDAETALPSESPEASGLPEAAAAPSPSVLASTESAASAESAVSVGSAAAALDSPAEDRVALVETPATGDLAASGAADLVAESAPATPEGVADAGALARAPLLASETAPAEQPLPALWIDATDDEAAALGELEPADAGVVAVLDWLDALDALEAEAS